MNPYMNPCMMQNFQWNNNNFNFVPNFINSGFGPNPNMDIQGLNMGGVNSGWQNVYNNVNPNQNQNQMNNNGIDAIPGKINAVFRTTRGMKLNILIDPGKPVSELIQIYFTRIEKPDLFNKPQDICFIFNANKIDFKETKTVWQYFKNPFALITVNDIKGIIGA